MKELDEFLAACRPIKEAMEAAFDEVWSEDGERLKARCCDTEVIYMSGIFGEDMAYCEACKSEIRMILSPHVSPILLDKNTTSFPSDELIDRVGENIWFVVRKKGGDAA